MIVIPPTPSPFLILTVQLLVNGAMKAEAHYMVLRLCSSLVSQRVGTRLARCKQVNLIQMTKQQQMKNIITEVKLIYGTKTCTAIAAKPAIMYVQQDYKCKKVAGIAAMTKTM